MTLLFSDADDGPGYENRQYRSPPSIRLTHAEVGGLLTVPQLVEAMQISPRTAA